MEDWEKKLYKKFVQSRVTNPRELKGDTVWESEQWLTGSPRELVVFIQDILEQELDRARKEMITEIYNFVEGESGKSGRKEILEFISKLTTK